MTSELDRQQPPRADRPRPRSPDSADRSGLIAQHLVRIDPASSRRLLDDVSVHLKPRQQVALTGPSGSGKSLLLRALAHLDPLDEGRLLWQGQPVRRDAIPAFRAAVLLLLQHPVMDSGTVEDQCAMPYRLRHFRRRGKTFDRQAALQRVEASGRPASFLNQPAARLSGGERQLVALLRGLLLAPQVLLLDEPTSAMDAATAAVAERWIADWCSADSRRSFVWVTHDAGQAERMANTFWTLQAGRLVAPPPKDSP